jgi:Na+/serine symporter
VAVPLGAVALGLMLTLSGQALAQFVAAIGDLVWVGIQAIRPVLIPALYALNRCTGISKCHP